MKTNALEYLKHQHCQFRLSEHILSSAYPIVAQIMEEYAELSSNQANGDEHSESTCNLQSVSIRFNLVTDVMPGRNEYVLVKTPHCKYPATVGFWNGVKWLAVDDKCEIANVSEWLSLNGC